MLKTIRHLFQEELADVTAMDSVKETTAEEPLTAEEPESIVTEQVQEGTTEDTIAYIPE